MEFRLQSSMAESYGFFSKGSTSDGISKFDEEFDEEDVWAMVNEKTDLAQKVRKSNDSSSFSTPRGIPTASKMIPKTNNSINETKVHQKSAPVNIPDWSKIYKKTSSKKQGSFGQGYEDSGYGNGYSYDDDEDEDDEDEDGEDRIQPHEWIAKKLERSQISSFSVCEGVGRTLKGRDLSEVRKAVLTKTGFLE